MNREKTQHILELCRPDHVEDLNDPLIAEALEQLDQDSELSAWFEEQQLQDQKIRTELNRITPPSALKASILDGMYARAVTQDSTDLPDEFLEPSLTEKASPKVSRPSRPWVRAWAGIAALFVFASVFLMLQNRRSALQVADSNSISSNSFSTTDTNTLTAGVPEIIQFLGQKIEDFNSSKFNKRSEQIEELKQYLTLAGVPSPAVVPQPLERLPTIGCVSFDYSGTQLSMICFKNGQVYHLITADKADLKGNYLPNLSPTSMHFFEYRSQAFKVWSEGGQVYILTTKGTKKDIPNISKFI